MDVVEKSPEHDENLDPNSEEKQKDEKDDNENKLEIQVKGNENQPESEPKIEEESEDDDDKIEESESESQDSMEDGEVLKDKSNEQSAEQASTSDSEQIEDSGPTLLTNVPSQIKPRLVTQKRPVQKGKRLPTRGKKPGAGLKTKMTTDHVKSSIVQPVDGGAQPARKIPMGAGPGINFAQQAMNIKLKPSNGVATPSKSPAKKEEMKNPVELSGTLIKRGAKKKNWQARWFVLKPNQVQYFKNEKSAFPQGTIGLYGSTAVAVTLDFPKPHCFKVVSEGKELYCQAESPAQMEQWLDAISQNCVYIEKNDTSAVGHTFIKRNFDSPTRCQKCQSFIWGLGKPGYSCSVCNCAVHKKCWKELDFYCGSQKTAPVDK